MNDTMLAVVLPCPPALFGLMVVVEEWTHMWQARRRRRDAVRPDLWELRRHPAWRTPPEDRDDWGTR